MKKMLKRTLSLMLALLMVAGLAACGGNADQQPSNPPAGNSQPAENTPAGGGEQNPDNSADEVTLKWAVWDINLTTYYQPLIDAYVADHPNVKIEMVDLGSSDYRPGRGVREGHPRLRQPGEGRLSVRPERRGH